MNERTTLQLTLQARDLGLAESGPSRRAFREQPGLASLTPGPAPPLHGPLTDPQCSRDLLVLLSGSKAFHGLEPQPLPRGPLSIGQPATLRVPHRQTATGTDGQLSGERRRHHSIKFRSLRVEVADASDEQPQLRAADEERGRGLLLVDTPRIHVGRELPEYHR